MKTLIFILLLAACGKVPEVPTATTTTPTATPASAVPEVTPVSPTPTPPPPTPAPFAGCTFDSKGKTVSTFNQFIHPSNGQNVAVTIVGTVTCTDDVPELFQVFDWEIRNYCLSAFPVRTSCTITMSNLQKHADSNYYIDGTTTGGFPTLTENLLVGSY